MTDAAKTMTETLESVAAASNTAMKDGYEKAVALATDMGAFGKETMEAYVASAQAAGKGMEALTATTVDYTKAALEKGIAAAKSVTGAKSFQEVVELQADYAKTSLDAFLAHLNKSTDLMAASMKDSMKPLNERATAFMSLVQAQR
jgi:phasin family protein